MDELLSANTTISRLEADSRLIGGTVLVLPEGWEPVKAVPAAAARRARTTRSQLAEEVCCCEARCCAKPHVRSVIFVRVRLSLRQGARGEASLGRVRALCLHARLCAKRA